MAEDIGLLYGELGGAQECPQWRPGSWDLAVGDLLIELDEELHFNRYRALTLERPWASMLPWAEAYAAVCRGSEHLCLRAGAWGKRWINESSGRMFVGGGTPGDLASGGGAPRWKQRALYDAIKDAAAVSQGVRLARLSVFDDVAGVQLGAGLEGAQPLDREALVSVLESRTLSSDWSVE